MSDILQTNSQMVKPYRPAQTNHIWSQWEFYKVDCSIRFRKTKYISGYGTELH